MEFCNLVGKVPENIARQIGSMRGVPLRVPEGSRNDMFSTESNIAVRYENGLVTVRKSDGVHGSLKDNLFAMTGSPDEEVMPFYKRKKEEPLFWSEVQDTPENPAIVVLCKAVHLVNDVKTYMKVLNVSKDTALVLLVAGAAGFETGDGEILTMTRCLPDNIAVSMRKTKRISPEYMNSMMSLIDSNGYRYNLDMVVSVYAYYGSDMVNIKTLRESCVLFDPEAEVRAKAVADRLAAKKAREEELQRQKEEADEKARKHQEEVDRKKAEELALAEAAERANRVAAVKKPRSSGKHTAPKEISGTTSNGRNSGAELFLSMLGK